MGNISVVLKKRVTYLRPLHTDCIIFASLSDSSTIWSIWPSQFTGIV